MISPRPQSIPQLLRPTNQTPQHQFTKNRFGVKATSKPSYKETQEEAIQPLLPPLSFNETMATPSSRHIFVSLDSLNILNTFALSLSLLLGYS